MLRRVASQVSLRSRERKLQLFLDLCRPDPESSVVDVGVTNAPFGSGSTDNFFEALYPWPERVTGVGHTQLDRFAAAFPAVRAVRADGRDHDHPVGALRGVHPLEALGDADRRAIRAVGDDPRRVAREAPRPAE